MLKLNKIRRFLALGVVLAAGGLAATIVVKLYWAKGVGRNSTKLRPAADASLQKIRYTETKQGRQQWALTADRAEYGRDAEITRLSGVQLVVAAAASTGEITLTAERADYHNKTGDVQLAGNVRARSASGMEFSCNAADYQASRSRITAPDRVRFSDGMLTVEGIGMELMTASRSVRILKQVSARIVPGKEER
jgi:LPS export ABC transporter protein LptC